MDNFVTWFNLQEIIDIGPVPDELPPERRVDLRTAGIVDKKVPKPMRLQGRTSAFPTYELKPRGV